MFQLLIIRHGQSLWNEENRFTGWTDVNLSRLGIKESHHAALLLKEYSLFPDVVYTSVLKRSNETLSIILSDLGLNQMQIHKSWRLNERHYGALQGLNKADTAKEWGDEQVFRWRRSFDVRPPALSMQDSRHPCHDPLYKDVPKHLLPNAESLKDTLERLIPLWDSKLVPAIKSGKRILIVAHGNSIRALLKILMHISDEEIPKIEIPLGVPLLLKLDEDLYCRNIIELKKDEKNLQAS